MKKVLFKMLFINPHPDDTEFAAPSICLQAVQRDWAVTQVLMTSDEYGTFNDKFKGKRIRKIRKHEMYEAAKVYGTNEDGSPKIKLIWFGEIDGYLRFNRFVYKKLEKIILDIKPDVILTPDSFFTMDFHPDHMRTGWLTYLVCRNLPEKDRPKYLLLYHSFKADFFVKFPKYQIKKQVEAWAKHTSQTTPFLNKMLIFARYFYFLLRKLFHRDYSEGFRRATYSPDENDLKTIRDRLLYSLFVPNSGDLPRERYLPKPQDLGLK